MGTCRGSSRTVAEKRRGRPLRGAAPLLERSRAISVAIYAEEVFVAKRKFHHVCRSCLMFSDHHPRPLLVALKTFSGIGPPKRSS
jgi:hypothetical protein